MQEDNTTQPADDSSDSSSDSTELSSLNLSSNPAGQASSEDTTSTDTPAASASTTEDSASSQAASANTTDSPAAVEQPEPAGIPVPSGDLESIKASALQELAPIVNELDQEPEERYRTLMMLIQASDDQALIKDAYEAAEKIEDKKAKAEALLNIVNEINYFTGKGAAKPEV